MFKTSLNYKTPRKCKLCGLIMNLEDEIGKTIFENGSFSHSKCYRNKLENSKRNKLSPDEIDKKVSSMEQNSLDHINTVIVKNHMYKYFQQKYDIVLIPNQFFMKMESIFDGSFNGLRQPIPPEHILDMFQRGDVILSSIFYKNKIEGISKLNYDLAVLLGKYEKYLEWIKTQEEKNKEIIHSGKEKINLEVISARKENKESSSNILDDDEDE